MTEMLAFITLFAPAAIAPASAPCYQASLPVDRIEIINRTGAKAFFGLSADRRKWVSYSIRADARVVMRWTKWLRINNDGHLTDYGLRKSARYDLAVDQFTNRIILLMVQQ